MLRTTAARAISATSHSASATFTPSAIGCNRWATPSTVRRATGTWPSSARPTWSRSNCCRKGICRRPSRGRRCPIPAPGNPSRHPGAGRDPALAGGVGGRNQARAPQKTCATRCRKTSPACAGITSKQPPTESSPMTDTSDLLALGHERYLPIYRPRDLILERGQGARLWDTEGRDYIDFGAGIAVCSLGHCDPDLVAALQEQGGRLWHTSNVFYSEPPLRLAEELVAASRFAERVFLCNSGAEANEAAIKLVRKWAAAEGRAPERRVIVSFRGSFHGRTLATVTATAQPKYQEGYEPLPAGFRHVDFNDIAQLETAMAAGDVAAVLVEPVQGEGGVMPAADGFLVAVRALCDRHGALLVLDEIQCGMGRTGTLFAHWQDEVTPDIVTL